MLSFKLNNGTEIPAVGFGTWAIPDSDESVAAVRMALQKGFRHIDTASRYENEKSVGQAIAASGIARNQLWVTSKAWPDECGYDNILQAFDASLRRLGLDYLDLYLIHWPATQSRFADWRQRNTDTWRALEKLYDDGRVRAIGVSNFLEHHLQPLIDTCRVKPMVDQIEIHPGYPQQSTIDFCQKNQITVEAWSPFGRGVVFGNPTLAEVARKYGKSIAQVCLRWCLQKGIVPLPKSVTAERIQSNLDVFDFELTPTDMQTIDSMPNFGWSGQHPDEVEL